MIEGLLSLYFVHFGISWIIGMIIVTSLCLLLYRYEEKKDGWKNTYTNSIRLKHIVYSLLIALFNPAIYYILILGIPSIIVLFLIFEFLSYIWNTIKDIRIIR